MTIMNNFMIEEWSQLQIGLNYRFVYKKLSKSLIYTYNVCFSITIFHMSVFYDQYNNVGMKNRAHILGNMGNILKIKGSTKKFDICYLIINFYMLSK